MELGQAWINNEITDLSVTSRNGVYKLTADPDTIWNGDRLIALMKRHRGLDLVLVLRPGSSTDCSATVTVLDGDQEIETTSEGDGPVNALDAALRQSLSKLHPWISGITLSDYKVRIVDGGRGTAARTRVHILSKEGKETWGTVGVSDNIIEASWMALVDSLEFRAAKRG